MKNILIVEDDVKIASALQDYLHLAGYATDIISTGNEVLPYTTAMHPDLILLDLNLPDQDGLEICRELRKVSQVPVIIISARVEEIDRLLGLEYGADDYVCKPFSAREVVARVNANIRRQSYQVEPAVLSDDGFVVDELNFIVSYNGASLDVTPVEYQVLLALLEMPRRVWSRKEIHSRMYRDERVVSDRTIDSHIANLRKKLQKKNPDAECIVSVYGIGYKLDMEG